MKNTKDKKIVPEKKFLGKGLEEVVDTLRFDLLFPRENKQSTRKNKLCPVHGFYNAMVANPILGACIGSQISQYPLVGGVVGGTFGMIYTPLAFFAGAMVLDTVERYKKNKSIS